MVDCATASLWGCTAGSSSAVEHLDVESPVEVTVASVGSDVFYYYRFNLNLEGYAVRRLLRLS